ncbi:MAG: hypothetical protein WCE30_27075 [Mycobacterium sp.]
MSTGVNSKTTNRGRRLAGVLGTLVAVAALLAPPASADTVIGNLGDTLRVNYESIVADVTVHDVVPSDVPPGWTWSGSYRWRAQGGPWKANVTVHVIKAVNPYQLATAFTFYGVTPYADAYVSKHTTDPDALETQLLNAPPGSTVNGVVYWDVYKGLVTNVVLLNPATGTHIGQWNMWQPETPLP